MRNQKVLHLKVLVYRGVIEVRGLFEKKDNVISQLLILQPMRITDLALSQNTNFTWTR